MRSPLHSDDSYGFADQARRDKAFDAPADFGLARKSLFMLDLKCFSSGSNSAGGMPASTAGIRLRLNAIRVLASQPLRGILF